MLRAGAASVDITPSDVRGTFLAGFGMGRRAHGVHAPLMACATYVESDSGSVVLVSLDLVGLLEVWVERIRAAVTEIAGSRVVVACTHTHSGPDTMGYWGPSILKVFPRSDGKNPMYMHELVDRVAGCVDAAVRGARPVTMRATDVAVDPSWTRNDREGGGRYDHCVALAFDDERRRVATLVNYASHPETLWEHNHLISPDYVGALRDGIAERTGGVTVFLQGPLGAMLTPNCSAAPKDVDARMEYADAMGDAIAEAVVRALDGAEASSDVEVEHRPAPIRFANTNWRFKLLERLGFVDVVTRGDSVTSRIHSVRIGEVEIVTAPGEVCPELGERIRAAMTGRYRVVVTLCEDEFGYMLEPSMFDEPEYGYEVTMSLGRATADTLLATYGALAAADG